MSDAIDLTSDKEEVHTMSDEERIFATKKKKKKTVVNNECQDDDCDGCDTDSDEEEVVVVKKKKRVITESSDEDEDEEEETPKKKKKRKVIRDDECEEASDDDESYVSSESEGSGDDLEQESDDGESRVKNKAVELDKNEAELLAAEASDASDWLNNMRDWCEGLVSKLHHIKCMGKMKSLHGPKALQRARLFMRELNKFNDKLEALDEHYPMEELEGYNDDSDHVMKYFSYSDYYNNWEPNEATGKYI